MIHSITFRIGNALARLAIVVAVLYFTSGSGPDAASAVFLALIYLKITEPKTQGDEP